MLVGWKDTARCEKTKHAVHMTSNLEDSSDGDSPDEGEVVSEEVAEEAHLAYMTYQNAKSKYKEALKGRGVELKK